MSSGVVPEILWGPAGAAAMKVVGTKPFQEVVCWKCCVCPHRAEETRELTVSWIKAAYVGMG